MTWIPWKKGAQPTHISYAFSYLTAWRLISREGTGTSPEHFGAGCQPFLMAKTIPASPMSWRCTQHLLQRRHIISSYHIISYPILSYHVSYHIIYIISDWIVSSLTCTFICLIFAHLLAARSAFPMSVNLHGLSVHESLEVLLLNHSFLYLCLLGSSWTSLSLSLASLTHPPFISLVLLQIKSHKFVYQTPGGVSI